MRILSTSAPGGDVTGGEVGRVVEVATGELGRTTVSGTFNVAGVPVGGLAGSALFPLLASGEVPPSDGGLLAGRVVSSAGAAPSGGAPLVGAAGGVFIVNEGAVVTGAVGAAGVLFVATGAVGNVGAPLGGLTGNVGAPDGVLLTSKLISDLGGVTVGGVGSSWLAADGSLGVSFMTIASLDESLDELSLPAITPAATRGMPKMLALARVDAPPPVLMAGAAVSEGGLLESGGDIELVGSGREVLVVELELDATGAGEVGVGFLSTPDKSRAGCVCPLVCTKGTEGGTAGGLETRSMAGGLLPGGSNAGAVVCGGRLGMVFCAITTGAEGTVGEADGAFTGALSTGADACGPELLARYSSNSSGCSIR